MNLARKKRPTPWTLHRLEAYATLTLRSLERCLEKQPTDVHELAATTRTG